MYSYPRLSGSYPLNMYYSPWRKGSYPLNMYFYPRRSGNFPRLSGNFLWRMGFYPVSEYSNLCFLPTIHRGASGEMPTRLTGTLAPHEMRHCRRTATWSAKGDTLRSFAPPVSKEIL